LFLPGAAQELDNTATVFRLHHSEILARNEEVAQLRAALAAAQQGEGRAQGPG
jgi:hypothetical protein